MPKVTVKFSGDWAKLRKKLEKGLHRNKPDILRALRHQLVLLRGDIIEYIDSEKHGIPNSPLTILAKGSSRPLVDRGDLRQSVAVEEPRWGKRGLSGRVGVKRKHGKANVAKILHEGAIIKVTPKVRAAVFTMIKKRRRLKTVVFPEDREEGGGRAGAKEWKIEGRPFMREPFEAATTRIRVAMEQAIHATLRKL